jgi:hypothetical protein
MGLALREIRCTRLKQHSHVQCRPADIRSNKNVARNHPMPRIDKQTSRLSDLPVSYIRAFHGSSILVQLDHQLQFQLCPNLPRVRPEVGKLEIFSAFGWFTVESGNLRPNFEIHDEPRPKVDAWEVGRSSWGKVRSQVGCKSCSRPRLISLKLTEIQEIFSIVGGRLVKGSRQHLIWESWV